MPAPQQPRPVPDFGPLTRAIEKFAGAIDKQTKAIADWVEAIDDQRDVQREQSGATAEVAKAVGDGQRDTARQLGALAQSLSGSINVTAVVPRDDATIYRGFSGTITGTTALTVWNPPTGLRFKLKGFAITGIVRTLLASTNEVLVWFGDSADSNRVVAPIAALPVDVAASTHIFGNAASGTAGAGGNHPFVCDLGSGRLGSSDTANLVITSDDIGSGVISFAGVVWGDEVKV